MKYVLASLFLPADDVKAKLKSVASEEMDSEEEGEGEQKEAAIGATGDSVMACVHTYLQSQL